MTQEVDLLKDGLTTEELHDTTNNKTEKIEVRKLQINESVVEYKFFPVTSAEDWPEASDFKSRYEMTLGNRKLSINLLGMSYGEWETIEEKFPFPEEPKDIENVNLKQAHAIEVDMARQKRKVYVFEKCIGLPLPGNKLEDKVNWLNDRSMDSVDSLFDYIENNMTGITDSPMLMSYNLDISQAQAIQCVEFSGWDDWKTASQTQAFFRLARSFDDFIAEFLLRRISHDVKTKIDIETQRPEPPRIPSRNPTTKRLDPNVTEPNFKDPRWLRTCRALRQKRTVLMIDAAVSFSIPGETIEEKYSWLCKRLLGDVHKLYMYIENELCGYKTQFDSFTAG